MRIVLLGPPGAGKGTQAKLLADRLGVAHIASGDLFRHHLGQGTDLGKLAKAFMDRGDLVPDDITIRMVLERIAQPDARNGYILDGFPRTVPQAAALDAALAREGQRIERVPLIAVETEELVRRLAGRWVCRRCQTPYHEQTNPPRRPGVCDRDGGELYQRDDDKPAVVRARLDTYERQTALLIGYYDAQDKLIRVDGQRSVDAVTQDLLGIAVDRVGLSPRLPEA